MAKPTISTDKLSAEIHRQLGLYQQEVLEAVNDAGARAIKKLVKLTRDSAPVRTGRYYQAITSQTTNQPSGNRYVWGVKAPHYRLTHLLVKGHPTSNGGRTNGDPFLANALDIVLPEYEKEVEEALKNAK